MDRLFVMIENESFIVNIWDQAYRLRLKSNEDFMNLKNIANGFNGVLSGGLVRDEHLYLCRPDGGRHVFNKVGTLEMEGILHALYQRYDDRR
jgi:hypothetical protein